MSTLNTHEERLDKFLENIPDEPPVPHGLPMKGQWGNKKRSYGDPHRYDLSATCPNPKCLSYLVLNMAIDDHSSLLQCLQAKALAA